MKSNVCIIKKGGVGIDSILSEVEKVASYNGLEKKQALRLRLLAEELVGMLPELVKNFDGCFWMQNNGNKYELHVELSVDSISIENKQALIAVSASKKNAAAGGFMGRICEIAENMLLYSKEMGEKSFGTYDYLYDYGGYDYRYSCAWTLDNYTSKREEIREEKSEDWDQLEKSIVAKLADDVIVGVRGKNVDIIIVKEF